MAGQKEREIGQGTKSTRASEAMESATRMKCHAGLSDSRMSGDESW